ncbi:cytochrome P450 [Nemania sp. FL0031]|nr:cytochrome P450 [Nemania sp. FL0031]
MYYIQSRSRPFQVVFSPLANIPGPRIAAFTYFCGIYYDVLLEGQYFRQIAKMHERYAMKRPGKLDVCPIVRIDPYEVHFNDPEFIDPLFLGLTRKTDKYEFTAQNSIVATLNHDLHLKRRNTINAFFSSASIRRLQHIMQEKMANLLIRLDKAVLLMHYVIKACTSDVITKWAFGDLFHFMDEEDYAAPYMKSTDESHLFNHAMCHFPIVGTILAKAPDWAIHTFLPGLSDMWNKKRLWMEQVVNIKNSPNPDRVKSAIFEGIPNSNVPENEKENSRLAHKAQLVRFTGQGTTGMTLSAALYQLLANPKILKKVKDELAEVIPWARDIPTWHQIETLPYFNVVMQEVLRVHPGIVSRLPRVSPDQPIIYQEKTTRKQYVIPAGSPTNMTIQIAHMNPEVFEDSYKFRPERWLEDGNQKLHRGFLGFARGTRNCIGMNFARQEMFIILATIIRKYDLYQGQEGPTLELYHTVRERDIDVVRDMITPFPARGSHGLRVRVRA